MAKSYLQPLNNNFFDKFNFVGFFPTKKVKGVISKLIGALSKEHSLANYCSGYLIGQNDGDYELGIELKTPRGPLFFKTVGKDILKIARLAESELRKRARKLYEKKEVREKRMRTGQERLYLSRT